MAAADPGTAGEDAPAIEEKARATWYALISRLFYEAPDRGLLDALAASAGSPASADEPPLLAAWRRLGAACARSEPEAVREEFEALFVGVGKAPVTPYTSAYAAPIGPDRHLLHLRETLDARGLARHGDVFEAEDHVAGLCDVMRWMIEGGAPVEEQQAFFRDFVDPGMSPFCAAICSNPLASFYGEAAQLTRAFLEVERDAFDMHVEAR